MNEGQLPLLLSFMIFTIAFMAGLTWQCVKYVKRRVEIDNNN